MSSYDDFDTSGLKLQTGDPIGGSWSGKGDTTNFTIPFKLVVDPVTVTQPVHDPPVAWRVYDNALARMGIPCIAMPSFAPGAKGEFAMGAAEYMDPEPIILDGEPGRLS